MAGRNLHDLESALARPPFGLVTRSDARRAGISDRTLLRRVTNGTWREVARGVYLPDQSSEVDQLLLLHAAELGIEAVASHRSALWLWGGAAAPETPEITVATTAWARDERFVVHRHRDLDADDITRRHGVAVTTPVRTMLDLGAVWGPDQVLWACRKLRRLGLFTPADLEAMLQRRARRGRDGVVALREAIRHLPPGDTESDLEDELWRIMVSFGIPLPRIQYWIDVGGRRYRADFAYPEIRLAVEADGPHHEEPAQQLRDGERDRSLRSIGWHTLRLPHRLINEHPERTAALMLRTIEQLRAERSA